MYQSKQRRKLISRQKQAAQDKLIYIRDIKDVASEIPSKIFPNFKHSSKWKPKANTIFYRMVYMDTICYSLLAMQMAFWRFENAFSYLKNPMNQKSKLSSVTTSMYFFAGSLTFSLRFTFVIFVNGIKTCRKARTTAS